MRIFFILLSFGVLLALVQCSNAARKTEGNETPFKVNWFLLAVEPTSSELEEDDDVETNVADRSESINDSSSDEYGFDHNAARFDSDSSSEEFEDRRSVPLNDDSSDDDSRSDDDSDDDEWNPVGSLMF